MVPSEGEFVVVMSTDFDGEGEEVRRDFSEGVIEEFWAGAVFAMPGETAFVPELLRNPK